LRRACTRAGTTQKNDSLSKSWQPEPADKLFSRYRKFGEVPFIFGDANHTVSVRGFNHMQYAEARCDEICAGT
jgi:hypothetical protein